MSIKPGTKKMIPCTHLTKHNHHTIGIKLFAGIQECAAPHINANISLLRRVLMLLQAYQSCCATYDAEHCLLFFGVQNCLLPATTWQSHTQTLL